MIYHFKTIKPYHMSTEEFVKFYKECYTPFLGYVKGIIYNEHDAEDINANVFLRLYTIHDNIRLETALGFVKRIINNECIDYMRKVKMRQERFKRYYQTSYCEPPKLPEKTLFVHVSKLPPMQRYLITMRYFMGYEPEELARLNKKSRSTVRNQLSAGLKTLRKQIHEA